jgi:hypothetical protein
MNQFQGYLVVRKGRKPFSGGQEASPVTLVLPQFNITLVLVQEYQPDSLSI